MDMVQQLSPLHDVLDKGNQAMQWIKAHSGGESVDAVIKGSISAMQAEEITTSTAKAILG